MRINKKTGHYQDWITQIWVKITGKTFNPETDKWLLAPIGNSEIIKDQFIKDLAKEEDLEIKQNLPNAGLLESFDDLELSDSEKALLNKKVIDFYEKTSNYNFEVWSEWCGLFRPLEWLLSVIFQQTSSTT